MTATYVLVIAYLISPGYRAVTTPVVFKDEQACKEVGEASLEWAYKYKCVKVRSQ